jgi:hypothetical protein
MVVGKARARLLARLIEWRCALQLARALRQRTLIPGETDGRAMSGESTPVGLGGTSQAREDSTDKLRADMVAYQAGDPEAFERLYVALAPLLRRRVLSLPDVEARSADALLQETFTQIHRARRTYSRVFPVEPWALAIAHHVAVTSRVRGRPGWPLRRRRPR